MDSLTQIVLGAACGEAVAGKKIGNRAMLWGAVGGTIPDLDVFAGLFTDEITSTSFHRGFMHSFLFAALMPWLLAVLTRRFYSGTLYKRRGYMAVVMAFWILFYVLAATGINLIPVLMSGSLSGYVLLPTLVLGIWLVYSLWTDYWRPTAPVVEASYLTWVWLFFWSIFTHPILDCFTSWGTQVFQPFSDLRVQWCSVSVIDPVATVPFLFLLVLASRGAMRASSRTKWNWAAIGWFSLYLCGYTLWHKHSVGQLFESKLQAQHIQYHRYYTNPTIMNNIVWNGVAEGDTAFYFSQYGFNDCEKAFGPVSTIPKNHHLLRSLPADSRAAYFLKWFSDGYYNVTPWHGDTLQVNDLRFGLAGDTLINDNYVFPILVFQNAGGEWEIRKDNRNRMNTEQNKRIFGALWHRVIHGRCLLPQ